MAKLKASEINAIAEQIHAQLSEDANLKKKKAKEDLEQDPVYEYGIAQFNILAQNIKLEEDSYTYGRVKDYIITHLKKEVEHKYKTRFIVPTPQTIKNKIIISQIDSEDFNFASILEDLRNEVFNS